MLNFGASKPRVKGGLGSPLDLLLAAVVDPGFPRRGHQPKWGLQPIIRPKFPKNCMKMKKIGPGERPKIDDVDPPLC